MNYKNHPGIWFLIWSVEILLLLPTVFGYLKLNPLTESSIKIILYSVIVYGMTYYNGKWIGKHVSYIHQ